jgi:hypothetical protein
LKALKIVALITLILWMAWMTWRIERVEYLASYACAAAVGDVLSHNQKTIRPAPDPYACPWQDFALSLLSH